MTGHDLASVRRRLLAVLWAAAGVSVACNVLSAEPSWVGRGVAAWPPIALLLVVEVLARSPLPAGRWRFATVGGTGSVAAVAAIASFTHMQAVARQVGESELVATLFPLSVDGLAIVASVALVEVNRRISTPPTHEVVDQALVDVEPPGPAEPAARGGGPVFVSPVVGASSPVLNGSGSTNHQST
jgi:hypothetical protein